MVMQSCIFHVLNKESYVPVRVPLSFWGFKMPVSSVFAYLQVTTVVHFFLLVKSRKEDVLIDKIL
jgi:hypothetical protein